jgi:hypothetical protein
LEMLAALPGIDSPYPLAPITGVRRLPTASQGMPR